MPEVPKVKQLEDELRRARIVIENLQARIGALIGENLDLLVRLHDAETAPDTEEVDR